MSLIRCRRIPDRLRHRPDQIAIFNNPNIPKPLNPCTIRNMRMNHKKRNTP